MDRLEHVTIIPGWTLRPGDNWYAAVAECIEDTTEASVRVAAMPDPDNPDPEAWTKTLDQLIVDPARHLIIPHSLGFIATINWAAGRKGADPGFKLGGLVSVAGNINKVGFPEIAPHFDSPDNYDPAIATEEDTNGVLRFGDKMRLVRNSLQYRPTVVHGAHDPFVPYEHAHIIRELLEAEMIIDQSQAHFSGIYTPDQGEPIPATHGSRVGRAVVPPLQREKLYNQMPWYAIAVATHNIIHASYFLHERDQLATASTSENVGDPLLDSINRITATLHEPHI
jgi:predicted alpha/beta hydrolase family esterase